jgi:hypothetical protein
MGGGSVMTARIHVADLPAAVRKRIAELSGVPLPATRRAKPSRSESLAAPCPGHCACGKPCASYLDWEKHSNRTKCSRFKIDMETLKGSR